MCRPQILMVPKKEASTAALRRMNFISLFIESLFLVSSRKMSFQVLFSCSIFYDSDTGSIMGWYNSHNNSHNIFFKLCMLRRKTYVQLISKASLSASYYIARHFFDIMHIDSIVREGWRFYAFIFREKFGLKPGNNSWSWSRVICWNTRRGCWKINDQ